MKYLHFKQINIVLSACLSYNPVKLIGDYMINYIKNIKNPALKCFFQLFPLFVIFFIWKDFGAEIGQFVGDSLVKTSAFISPVFRFAGEYVMALFVFLTMWSACVFSKVIKSEKDINIVKFWKNVAHAASITLFFYCVLYILDTVKFINDTTTSTEKELTDLNGLIMITGTIALVTVFVNIYLFGKMSDLKKEQLNRSEIYS
jgi:hypothetical protein